MLFGVSEGLLKLDCRGKSDKKKTRRWCLSVGYVMVLNVQYFIYIFFYVLKSFNTYLN